VDHPTLDVVPFVAREQSRSPSPSAKPARSWLENYIGQTVAGAAAALVVALDEARDGGVTSGTRQQGGELVAELVRLRNFMVGRFDFETAARTHGPRVLQEACCEMSSATATALVGEVLKIVASVVRQELH
jgi:hypothetical protein